MIRDNVIYNVDTKSICHYHEVTPVIDYPHLRFEPWTLFIDVYSIIR